VVEAREFAVRELAMPDGKSFRRYADLGRPFAIWSVVATPEFSIEPRRWCFPIAGCVSYLGFFDPDDAHARADRLAVKGDDVSVGGGGDLFDARSPARSGLQHDAGLARAAAARHDLPRARA
jgi:predicted aminopeptidase